MQYDQRFHIISRAKKNRAASKFAKHFGGKFFGPAAIAGNSHQQI